MFGNFLTPVVIVLGISYTIYKLVELLAHRKERLRLIEKIDFSAGVAPSPDVFKWLTPSTSPGLSFSTLRIALLLIGLGLGLGIATAVPYFSDTNNWEFKNQMILALMIFFGGLGLLTSYLIEQKNRK
ncbi:MAG: hypothetical protein LBN37_03545 [Bacteroidales bacterium]|jgi:hypothetical protein|nr:hypothetical protein [Bacteroidales bacterium]